MFRIDWGYYPSFASVAFVHNYVRMPIPRSQTLSPDCDLRLCSFALYLMYYPEHLKYVDITSHPNSYTNTTITTKHEKSAAWRLSVALGWATALHLYVLPQLRIIPAPVSSH